MLIRTTMNIINYFNVTQNDSWQCLKSWRDLRDPTSETFCGRAELWLPPTGTSSAHDLTDLISEPGICVFVIQTSDSLVSDLHTTKIVEPNRCVPDALGNLTNHQIWYKTQHYGIYYTS